MEARATPPGWYADPRGRFEYRYHNGEQWTSDVAVNGRRFVDAPVPPQHPTAPRPPRGMAIAAFITGLSSVLVGWVPFIFVLAAASAVLAIIFGMVALNTSRHHEGYGRSFAVAGLVLAPIGLAVCVGGFFFTKYVLDEISDFVEPGPHELVIDEPCAVTAGQATLGGSIHNLDDREHDYRIVVEFTSTSDDSDLSTVAVRHVSPDQIARWSASRLIDGTSVECRVTDVYGPLPFDENS